MNKTVTIPQEEYDRLVLMAEDLEDIQTLQAYRSDPDNKQEEAVPADFVKRMLDGEALLKLWREHRVFSINKLAQLSDVNRVQIGEIEKGTKTGSIHTLKKLADALGIMVDDLI